MKTCSCKKDKVVIAPTEECPAPGTALLNRLDAVWKEWDYKASVIERVCGVDSAAAKTYRVAAEDLRAFAGHEWFLSGQLMEVGGRDSGDPSGEYKPGNADGKVTIS
jgi:hypothetical protein